MRHRTTSRGHRCHGFERLTGLHRLRVVLQRGRLVVVEPAVGLPLPAAQRYEVPGYHPTAYSIRWDEAAREWRIALTGLVKRG